MKFSDFKPVGQLATFSGVKGILYGPPGTGKTPMFASLPAARTIMGVTEAGLLSVRGWGKPPAVWLTSFDKIEEFRIYMTDPRNQRELAPFDTYIIDSLTKLCDIVLKHFETRYKDGRKAYGEMSKYIMVFLQQFFFLPNKNVIFACQMATEEVIVAGQGFNAQQQIQPYNRPLLPGKELNKKVNHDIDEVWYVHHTMRPDGSYGPAIATTDTGIAMARSRCGKLAPLEPPDLNYLFAKINS